MSPGSSWRQNKLDDYAYRPVHQTRHILQEEQDRASGGDRQLSLPDSKIATARIKLVRKRHARRVYAVLIWDHTGKRTELHLGEVVSASREVNLRRAWAYVHKHDLLTPAGRAAWSAAPPRHRPRIE